MQDIEQIENKRTANPSIDALYILSPFQHVLDCLMADFEKRRYKRSHLVFTSGQLCAVVLDEMIIS